MRYRLQQQNLIVWCSKTKNKKKYRTQCPATNGNRSFGEGRSEGGGELITYIFFVTKELAAQGVLRRFLSHGSPDDAEISVNWEEYQFRCHNRTEHSTADVEEIEVIGTEGQGDGSRSAVFDAHKTGERSYCSFSEVRKKCSMRDFFHGTGSEHTPNPRERQIEIKVSKLLVTLA